MWHYAQIYEYFCTYLEHHNSVNIYLIERASKKTKYAFRVQ